MNRHGRIGATITTTRRALATTALVALVSLAPATIEKAVAQQSPVAFAIAGGPLDTALSRFGVTSGVQVLYGSAVTKGLTTKGVNGSL
ncbi:TonB-dependent siderophore receptor, partial [Rhizobiaceae sp. 2RAB30]